MNTVTALGHTGLSTTSRTAAIQRSERLFFTGLAVVFLLIALLGFGPTYYFKHQFATPTLTPLVHVHGAVFTLWLVLLIAQTGLVAAGRRDLHKRLGWTGAVLVVVMLVLGVTTAIIRVKQGAQAPGGIPPLVFLAVPLFSIVTFATLFGFAVRYRTRPDIHKRLIMIGTIDILGAATGRLTGMFGLGAPGLLGAPVLLILAVAIYDYVSRGRVHPATMWAGGAVSLLGPARLMVGGTDTWLMFARWLTT